MAKKKGFDYDSTAEQPWASRIERASIAERAEAPKRAMELAKTLAGMPAVEWDHLPLEPVVVKTLRALAAIHSKARGARRRELGRVARLLWNEDLDALETAMGAGRAGRTEREHAIEDLVRWRTRMIDNLKEGLTAFLDVYPTADRQRIRQLATQCVKQVGRPGATRANRALLDAMKESAGL